MENNNVESDVEKNVHEENTPIQTSEYLNEEDSKTLIKASCHKDEIIGKIIGHVYKRRQLIKENQTLQHKLAMFKSRSLEKDNCFKMSFKDVDENYFKNILDSINKKEKEYENLCDQTSAKIESIKEEIKVRKESFVELQTSFKESTQKAALHSVNSETGEYFTANEVKELLAKEEEVSNTLQKYQLQSIQRRHNLNLAMEKKRNLAEGPLNFAEYEMMCIETQNNKEIIQPISEEIKNIMKKAANIINVLSHMEQKLYLTQKEKNKALKAEKKLKVELNEMRDMLFKEKMKYTKMKHDSKELEHKFILLQYPGLIEDYNQIQLKNEEAHKELQRLKTVYEEELKIINK